MLGLDPHHSMVMNRNNIHQPTIHRSNGNNVLGLNSDDDFNCLMTDPIFQATVLSQLTPITSPIIVNPSQDPTSTHLINTRKRTMSAYDSSNVIDSKNDQTMVTNCVPNKRSVILPAIKSEPDGGSLNSVASSSTNASNCAISPPLVTQQQQQQQSQSQSQSQLSQSQSQQQQTNTASSENGSNDSFPMQCIRFLPFLQQNWHVLCDQSLQEL